MGSWAIGVQFKEPCFTREQLRLLAPFSNKFIRFLVGLFTPCTRLRLGPRLASLHYSADIMDTETLSSQHHILIIVYDVVVLLGAIMFVCTLLPAVLSRAVQRSVAWYSLMTAWLVYSLSYGLLVGRHEGEEPPHGLCLAQALLIYAVPAL